jgi:hypothetical protein
MSEYCEQQSGTAGFAFVRPPVSDFAADVLAQIKSTLKLTVSEIASCVGVTRQAIYNWKAGSEMKLANAAKLNALKNAADVISEANLRMSGLILSRTLPGGKTLLETIAAGGEGTAAARSLVAMINEESATRQRISQRFADRRLPPSEASNPFEGA